MFPSLASTYTNSPDRISRHIHLFIRSWRKSRVSPRNYETMKNQELVIEKQRWKEIRLWRHGYIKGGELENEEKEREREDIARK